MKKFSLKAFIALIVATGISLAGFVAPAYAAGTGLSSVPSFTARELTPAFTLTYTYTSGLDTSTNFWVDFSQLNLPSSCTPSATTAWADCGISSFTLLDGSNNSISTTGMTVERDGGNKVRFRKASNLGTISSIVINIASSVLRASSVVGNTSAEFKYADNSQLTAAYQITTANSYSVTFDPNGGSGTMASQSTNATTALSSNTYTRSGYTFGGWATSQANASAGTVAYADGANYDFLSATTLYAIWNVAASPSSSGNALANTGFSAAPYLALGSSMILFGLSIVLYPRRRESRH